MSLLLRAYIQAAKKLRHQKIRARRTIGRVGYELAFDRTGRNYFAAQQAEREALSAFIKEAT